MKATVMGGIQDPKDPITSTQELVVAPINAGTIVVRADQAPIVQKALSQLNFARISSGEVIKLGNEAEQGLNKTLDGFMAHMNKVSSPAVFKLFDQLQKGVEDAKLPEVLAKMDAKPGWVAVHLLGKKPTDVAKEAYEEVRQMLAGRTKDLTQVMHTLEGGLQTEMQSLFNELQAIETLKQQYRQHFGDFTVAAAVSQAFLAGAREYVAEQVAKAGENPNPETQALLQEMQNKLQLLESRSLALEGTYTRLPADSQIIQQIEQAGVTTLQETATTAQARFASIKMNLIALNGALQVKQLQAASERQATLDRQLADIRSQVTKEVAVKAAAAPGDNRLAQVAQIEKIIADANEIRTLVKAARESNESKFAEARSRFEQARKALLTEN